MTRDRKFSLSTQINLIFTLITLVTSILFVLIFRQTIKSFTTNQANNHFNQYFQNVKLRYDNNEPILQSEYYSYFIYNSSEKVIVDEYFLKFADSEIVLKFIDAYRNDSEDIKELDDGILLYKDLYYILDYFKDTDNEYKYIIAINDGFYISSLSQPISGIILIGFIAIILLGNAIILLWSSVTVERIKILELEVGELGSKSYRIPIKVEGSDEITELAKTIDKMRLEILRNDEVKQEMLQNLSHDIKTPIAVIKSYSEAIKDGITEIDDLDIIIAQTDILSEKVKKLLEWNRIEYIDDKVDFYPVNMNKIINTVANNFKFKKDVIFELDLDNSFYIGLEDHFTTLVSNIVENALRYARSIIKITLKDKKLTIYNDGEPIHEKFINTEFKPYEKGHKGEFGLGLTIVQKIVTNFNLKLIVRNLPEGVAFIIEPL